MSTPDIPGIYFLLKRRKRELVYTEYLKCCYQKAVLLNSYFSEYFLLFVTVCMINCIQVMAIFYTVIIHKYWDNNLGVPQILGQ